MGRRQAVVGLMVTIAVGLGTRAVPIGVPLWDKSLGDILYAVMVYFLLALVLPSLRPARLAASAFAICLLIEIFQLTGVPSRLPRVFQLVLGTTFAWQDVVCYAIGAAGAGAAHLLVRRRSRIGAAP